MIDHPSMINESSINNMLIDVYRSVNKELANHTKRVILETLGITIDAWGHVTSVSQSLKDEILNLDEVQQLKANLVEHIKAEVIAKLNTEMETKFYSKKAVTQIATSIIANLNKQIVEEIHDTIHDELLNSYSQVVKDSVYAIPQIQEIMLRKL